jgi:hypothetical protein
MRILHCNPQGELVVQSESFSKEHILRTNSIGVMAAISNWSHDPYRTFFKPTEQNYSAKYLNTSLYPAKQRPGLCRDRQRPKPQRSCLSCSAKPSQNPHSHSGQCLTDQSTLCYNSLTGQGQLLWVGVCLHHSLGRRFNLVSMVSINLRIWFDGVEQSDAGETIEREESQ